MRKATLVLGLTMSLTMGTSAVFAGGDEDDVNGYDTMGYYVYSTDDPDQAQQNDFDGMYVGIQAGVNINTAGYDFSQVDPSTDLVAVTTSNTDAIAGAILGWGITWDEFYLGLEANGRYTFGGNANGIYINQLGRVGEFNERWSSGFGFRIGGIVYNTALIYFYGGGAYAGFKSAGLDGEDGIDIPAKNYSKFGYALGAGFEVQMNRSFNIDMRYLWRSFNKISETAGNDTFSLTPRDNLIMLAGNYHFAV